MFALGIIGFIFLIVIPLIASIVLFFRRRPRAEISWSTLDRSFIDTATSKRWLGPIEVPELLFLLAAPIIGGIFIYVFQRDIEPFAVEHAPSLLLFYLPAMGAYWWARFRRAELKAQERAIIPYFLLVGMGIYALLFLHFISPSTLLGGIIFPYFGFPLYAPLPAFLYTYRLWVDLQPKAEEDDPYVASEISNDSEWSPYFWRGSMLNWMVLVACLLALYLGQLLLGQSLYSIVAAFTEGQDFLFSAKSEWF